MRNPQTEQLLRRLQSGEDMAMFDLADTYGPKIHQLAFRYLRNKEDAEEVVQDVLYKVYRNVGAVILDLPDHVQRIDVSSPVGVLSARAGSAACARIRH
jgi:hypothetical protein